jgi:hypothetical protein
MPAGSNSSSVPLFGGFGLSDAVITSLGTRVIGFKTVQESVRAAFGNFYVANNDVRLIRLTITDQCVCAAVMALKSVQNASRVLGSGGLRCLRSKIYRTDCLFDWFRPSVRD